MTITVVSAIGWGSTTLSAFDSALKKAGVYNYNIIPLSSIIPTGWQVIKRKKYPKNTKEVGYRLYMVMSEIRSNQSDKVIGAGLGWYQFPKGSGVFVEHAVEGLTEESVEKELKIRIQLSLTDLCAFRGIKFRKRYLHMSQAICPAMSAAHCALVAAVYKAEPW